MSKALEPYKCRVNFNKITGIVVVQEKQEEIGISLLEWATHAKA